MNLWITIIIIGLLTFAIRLSFILLFGVVEVPLLLRRALRFVPAAVLSAIILPDLLLRDQQLALGLDNDRLLAGVVAIGVAWFSKNVLLTIAVGMAVFVGLGLIGGR
jgi:branched-subunit amino acid transport protein